MFNFDFDKFKSDTVRNFSLVGLVAILIVGFISAFTDVLHWLLVILVAAYSFLTIAPLIFGMIDTGEEKKERLAWFCFKSAESAGMAVIGAIVLGVTAGFAAGAADVQFQPWAHLFSFFILATQALAAVGIAVAAGLATMLKTSGVELEAPPKPAPQVPAYQPVYQQPYPQAGYAQPEGGVELGSPGVPQTPPPGASQTPPPGAPQPPSSNPANVVAADPSQAPEAPTPSASSLSPGASSSSSIPPLSPSAPLGTPKDPSSEDA